LSFDALHRRLPRLIVCDISGYGDSGPYCDKKAYDLLIQSESGFLSVTGTPEEPCKAAISIADISAGMYAYSGILAALLLRGRTGTGTRIEISLLETMIEWMGYPLYYAFEGAPPPPRSAAAHATIFPYGPFPVGDGTSVMLGLQNEREWSVFCTTVLQQPALAADPRFSSNSKRVAARAQLRALIADAFSSLTAAQVTARLQAAQIANAHLNEISDVWNHPQLNARRRWSEVQTPAGMIAALRPPGLPEGCEPRMDAVPALGQHSAAILAELGYAEAAIERLREQQAI